jgi:hypothetical protein
MKIKFYKDDIVRCQKFAERQLETSKGAYCQRAQANQDVILRQITEGKLGEIAVARFLRSLNYKVNAPDFAIYKGRKKSYDADLTDGRFFWHVKTQSQESAKRYGTSFLFTDSESSSDPLITNPANEDVMIFVLIDGNEADVLGMVRAKVALERQLYREPRLDRLKPFKSVLYLDDLKPHLTLKP